MTFHILGAVSLGGAPLGNSFALMTRSHSVAFSFTHIAGALVGGWEAGLGGELLGAPLCGLLYGGLSVLDFSPGVSEPRDWKWNLAVSQGLAWRPAYYHFYHI